MPIASLESLKLATPSVMEQAFWLGQVNTCRPGNGQIAGRAGNLNRDFTRHLGRGPEIPHRADQEGPLLLERL
jgi:hypothetical protein